MLIADPPKLIAVQWFPTFHNFESEVLPLKAVSSCSGLARETFPPRTVSTLHHCDVIGYCPSRRAVYMNVGMEVYSPVHKTRKAWVLGL